MARKTPLRNKGILLPRLQGYKTLLNTVTCADSPAGTAVATIFLAVVATSE
jgi:hypothetical protein